MLAGMQEVGISVRFKSKVYISLMCILLHIDYLYAIFYPYNVVVVVHPTTTGSG